MYVLDFFVQKVQGTNCNHGNPSYPPKATPPRNKGLIRPYEGKPMVNKPLIRSYFSFCGGGGGGS